jgi:hypothetical protein
MYLQVFYFIFQQFSAAIFLVLHQSHLLSHQFIILSHHLNLQFNHLKSINLMLFFEALAFKFGVMHRPLQPSHHFTKISFKVMHHPH